ncbi:uncharacterized protein EV154DRAFT_572250 [Mucor mucedo]|uniref:uncharacterized protein n=1 Tax=Mucor mucedo TaxID=29922 RepID=UPI00221FE8FA|nr:uncharacterized protein EV154DRAFT_572250 [Mucor mucedo]KAI7865118.1 hypothetical protein EV154DRAFT_572250 [Mucor mucedo]
MAQEINTHRVLTIAGSVALVALTAYGVWKWNKTDVKNEDDKKKKTRQVEKQSHLTEEKETLKELEHIIESVQTEPEIEEQVVVTEVEVVEVVEAAKAETPKAKEAKVEAPKAEAPKVEEEAKVEEAPKVEAPVVVKEAVVEQVLVEAEQVLAEINKVVTETEAVVTEAREASKEEEEEYVVVAKREESQSCATSSTEETDVWTPEHESDNHKNNTPEPTTTPITTTTPTTTTSGKANEEYIWKADATATSNTEEGKDWASSTIVSCSKLSSDAPVFVPRQQMKKNPKKRLSRAELIEQQRQNHTPHAKARCSHWPRCTNKNCKFWHPFRDCREGETCPFGNKCMFIHPSDYVEPPRVKKNQTSDEEEQFIQQDQFQFAA